MNLFCCDAVFFSVDDIEANLGSLLGSNFVQLKANLNNGGWVLGHCNLSPVKVGWPQRRGRKYMLWKHPGHAQLHDPANAVAHSVQNCQDQVLHFQRVVQRLDDTCALDLALQQFLLPQLHPVVLAAKQDSAEKLRMKEAKDRRHLGRKRSDQFSPLVKSKKKLSWHETHAEVWHKYVDSSRPWSPPDMETIPDHYSGNPHYARLQAPAVDILRMLDAKHHPSTLPCDICVDLSPVELQAVFHFTVAFVSQ